MVMKMLTLSLKLLHNMSTKVHRLPKMTVVKCIADKECSLESCIAAIKPLDENAMEKCRIRVDNLTKPLNSLGAFENLAIKIAGITRIPRPHNLKKSIIVVAEDVDDSKTQLSSNYLLSIFAAHVSASIVPMKIERSDCERTVIREQVIAAIEAGIKCARQETAKGVRILGIGISRRNSTTNAALFAAFCGIDKSAAKKPEELQEIFYTAADPLEFLCQAGKLELAGMVGVILGGASGGAAIILDSLTTCLAALLAVKLAPKVRDYLIGSLFFAEPLHNSALEMIEVPSYLELDMDLGAGTGAALGISLVDASLHMLNDMKTFGEAKVAVAQDGPGALRQSGI
jgi:nicotinate-nucleotide--dimethylbenzimidazole phosphoribosyltransferase